MEQHDLSINGVNLHTRISGDPDAPPLLLLHGWPDSGRCWAKVVPLLADRYRVIVPDMRGFGASDAPPDLEAYRMQVLLGDVTGLIEWAEATRDAGSVMSYFLVHGEEESATSLANVLAARGTARVIVPDRGTAVQLD